MRGTEKTIIRLNAQKGGTGAITPVPLFRFPLPPADEPQNRGTEDLPAGDGRRIFRCQGRLIILFLSRVELPRKRAFAALPVSLRLLGGAELDVVPTVITALVIRFVRQSAFGHDPSVLQFQKRGRDPDRAALPGECDVVVCALPVCDVEPAFSAVGSDRRVEFQVQDTVVPDLRNDPENGPQGLKSLRHHGAELILPESEWYYENAIGGKTGYTDSAWRTLVGAAEKDGRTLVCVTMHGPDANDFGDMKRLFEYGFNNFKNVPVTGSDGKVLGSVTIANDFSIDDLWTEEADGRVNYYYEKIFVGSAEKEAVPTVTAAPTETPTETPAATETPAVTEAPAPTKAPEKESGVLMSLVRVLLVVLVLGVLLLAIVLYKRHLDSERKKRRIRRKKKEH